MQYIDRTQAALLYENIDHVEGLTEKERIPKYRTILESLFRELVSDEKRYLDNLNARIVFITTEYKVPLTIKNLAHHLRRFANTVVQEANFLTTPADDARCLYALTSVIAHFSRTKNTEQIRQSFEPF